MSAKASCNTKQYYKYYKTDRLEIFLRPQYGIYRHTAQPDMRSICQLLQIRDPFTDFLCPFQSPNESLCSNAGSPKPHYSNHTSPAALPTSPRQRNKGSKRGRIQMLTVIERVR